MSHQLPAGWVEVRQHDGRINEFCIRSECGRFTIVKYGIADNQYRYELWDMKNQIAVGMSSAAHAIREYNRLTTSSNSAAAAGTKSGKSPDGVQADLLLSTEAS